MSETPKRVRRLRREIRRLAIQLRENRAERRERRLARGVLLLASTTKRLLLLALSSPLLRRVARAEGIRRADAHAAASARLSLLALRLLGRHGRRDRRERLTHVRVLQHRRDGAAKGQGASSRYDRRAASASSKNAADLKIARSATRSASDAEIRVFSADARPSSDAVTAHEPRDVNRRQRGRRRAAVRLEQIRTRVIAARVSRTALAPVPV